MRYQVIKDTREQLGWDFVPTDNCLGTVVRTLGTGDYSIEGLENRLVIERKGTLSEFAQNIFQKRFENELVRLDEYDAAFIILEFDMDTIFNFPVGSGIPKSKWDKLRVNKWLILKKLFEIEFKHKVKIVFAGKYGKEVAASIFKRAMEMYGEVN